MSSLDMVVALRRPWTSENVINARDFISCAGARSRLQPMWLPQRDPENSKGQNPIRGHDSCNPTSREFERRCGNFCGRCNGKTGNHKKYQPRAHLEVRCNYHQSGPKPPVGGVEKQHGQGRRRRGKYLEVLVLSIWWQ